MNPGSEYEPPTTPYPVPGRRFEQPGRPPTTPPMPPAMPPPMPPMPPTMPPMPPRPPRRRSWLLPTLAAALVVLVAAGGVGAYFLISRGSPAVPVQPSSSRTAAPAAAAGPDVCAMLPAEEAERLVPGATVAKSSKDSDYSIDFTCDWQNQRISYGEFWRSREVDVRIEQHKGDGAKTGRAMAQNSYEIDYRGAKYGATAKPELDPDEKQYVSPVKDVQGVGEGAFAQYTWRRDGKLLWYSFGEAYARVGDMTIKVKFQAGQQRKDAQILSSDGTQSINEPNAIREVSGLVTHFAKGVAAWQARNPGVLAKPAEAAVTQTPTARPTPSPTVLAVFPPACQAVTATATGLVPGPTTRARGTEAGDDNQTECRWLNLNLPGGAGIVKVRSAVITTHRFTNRAGAADESAAKSYYASQYGGDKNTAGSTIGGITWSALKDVEGVGDQAYTQFVQTRQGEVFASSGTVLARKGSLVVTVDYAGAERPKSQPANSPKVTLMARQEAQNGALILAKAYLAELLRQPAGS